MTLNKGYTTTRKCKKNENPKSKMMNKTLYIIIKLIHVTVCLWIDLGLYV